MKPTADPPSPTYPTPLTEDRLRDLCAIWQKRLRLQDWSVDVALCCPGDLNDITAEAECWSNLRRKRARLLIVRPEARSRTPNDIISDQETTLVHELLHLHTAPMNIETDTAENVAMEQMVDLVAEALVSLARAGETASAPPA